MAIVSMDIHSEFEIEEEYVVSGATVSNIATDIAQAVARIGMIGTIHNDLDTETRLIALTLIGCLGRIDKELPEQIIENVKLIAIQIIKETQNGSFNDVVN